ncbi:MAG: hypothetical protein A2792_04630 [Sphingomonadales bacterium RIFCSPHIGHO2_01_FULL_65_20]|nr:MAG: hypothetical protein A2792_04630 [Sphingomonadales bacterium RIFCSPHIGHO2_01_FULL_65_20]
MSRSILAAGALTAAVLALAACDNSGSSASDNGAAPAAGGASASGPSAPAAVVEATRCWGLVQGATVLAVGLPEMAAELPAATEDQKRAWFNEAQRRAAAAGLTVPQFQALLDEYQMSNRFATSADLRQDSVEPLKACLASTPPEGTEPPDLAQG